jgi:hypothetical protein
METDKPDFIASSLTLVLAAVLALAPGSAGARAQEQAPMPTPAQEQPPAPAPVIQKEADAATAVKPPPNRQPIKRRSVQQVIEPTPRIVTDGYRPTLTVRPPAALPGPASSTPPPSSARMTTCGAGGCFDSNGARFNGSGNGGAGNTLLSPKGQLCVQGPVNAQCF